MTPVGVLAGDGGLEGFIGLRGNATGWVGALSDGFVPLPQGYNTRIWITQLTLCFRFPEVKNSNLTSLTISIDLHP